MMAHHAEGQQRIVVGVSGSPASRAALAWAAHEAHARQALLLAVHAWEPTHLLRAPYAPAPSHRTAGEDQDLAQRTLDIAIADAVPAGLDVEVHTVVAQGLPAAVLLQHCGQALMLVLGHRAPQRSAPVSAGPVTRVCTARACCPVVSVPTEAPAGHARRTAAPAEHNERALTSG